jgi:hypothetical protein
MSKQITQFTAQLVTFETTIPVVEVLARLDKDLNKQGSGKIRSSMKDATNKEEIESSIKQIIGENDFLYVSIPLTLVIYAWSYLAIQVFLRDSSSQMVERILRYRLDSRDGRLHIGKSAHSPDHIAA